MEVQDTPNPQDYIRRVAFIGNYPPRKCGIATFSHDIYQAFTGVYKDADTFVVAVNDKGLRYDYPSEVKFEFEEADHNSYIQAANFVNAREPEVACVQHEYGIYGGDCGEYILTLMEHLQMPIITTLHTILREPSLKQREVLKRINQLSSSLIVMSEKGRDFLIDIYNIEEFKITVIPHGIPDLPFVDSHFYKDKFGVEERTVLLTFGLLSPNKGIEYVIKALPNIVDKYPDLSYLIVGATHPNLVREQGEAYRDSLRKLAYDLGVSANVRFYNRFLDKPELMELLSAADIYITPYQNEAQITSGTLAYAVGAGKAVISTPYWHATELLAEERGVLVPFHSSEGISIAVNALLDDDTQRNNLRKRAYLYSRNMIWQEVVQRLGHVLKVARFSLRQQQHLQYDLEAMEGETSLPALNLSHLYRLTDATGILQHATYDFANFHEGYCLDDNARSALLAIRLLSEQNVPELREAYKVYSSFISFSFDRKTRLFKNFLSYGREWIEAIGSADSNGRAIWSLGTIIRYGNTKEDWQWAIPIFESSIYQAGAFSSPRTLAFALLGATEYLQRFPGDISIKKLARMLADQLVKQFQVNTDDEWLWLENVVSYDNARISQALIAAAKILQDSKMLYWGEQSLHWLYKIQLSSSGHFSPIGSNGFYTRNGHKASFDQQPIEAAAMVSAFIELYRYNASEECLQKAITCFEWFTGRNDLGVSLYQTTTGGCLDGLHIDFANQNQGAESTLSYLLARFEIGEVMNQTIINKHPTAVAVEQF